MNEDINMKDDTVEKLMRIQEEEQLYQIRKLNRMYAACVYGVLIIGCFLCYKGARYGNFDSLIIGFCFIVASAIMGMFRGKE